MGWKGAQRAAEAARRKQEREQVQRLRDLERLTKEQATLSALEQARLEGPNPRSPDRALVVHTPGAD